MPSPLLQDCELPHPGYANVVLGDPSPFLFYPISSTEVGFGGLVLDSSGGCLVPLLEDAIVDCPMSVMVR